MLKNKFTMLQNFYKNSPTVSNENLQDAKNENELTTTSSTTDYPKTDPKMKENAPTTANQILRAILR